MFISLFAATAYLIGITQMQRASVLKNTVTKTWITTRSSRQQKLINVLYGACYVSHKFLFPSIFIEA